MDTQVPEDGDPASQDRPLSTCGNVERQERHSWESMSDLVPAVVSNLSVWLGCLGLGLGHLEPQGLMVLGTFWEIRTHSMSTLMASSDPSLSVSRPDRGSIWC